MKKKLIAMVLGMAVCVGQILMATDIKPPEAQINIGGYSISCVQFACPTIAKPIESACNAKVNELQAKYEKIINDLTNEMNKMNDSEGSYKPNTNVTLPNIDEDLMGEAVISGLLGTMTVFCSVDCAFYVHEQRMKCKNSIRSMKNQYIKSIQSLIDSINQQYQQYQNQKDGDDDSDDSGGSNSSGSTSGTTSSGNSSNYNPYGSGGASSGGISSRGGTNEGNLESFKQQVKSNANADNNLVKGNKNKSSSQGDTSFYDVVGERPPSNSGFKDISQ